MGTHVTNANALPLPKDILCAKASMLIQNVPPALLVQFLREHRSKWADYNIDAYSAASLKAGSYAFPGLRPTRFSGSQIIMPLAHTVENEELCSGAFSELVFAPIDELFPDDALLLPSGFQVFPLDSKIVESKSTEWLFPESCIKLDDIIFLHLFFVLFFLP
ncbi:homeobox-leucine zipper protein REVOLUTA-like [Magnolia sinica]|uniref:homeobox-leucine zipper protein REVOLUTA-like n=1 Tax=Magnolia sinica TaxID=86752 RepID=UPI00265AAF4E|nr:homeobox-leucine zipper protein REVOLUTA-like [Magnolia sinica]